MDQNTRAVFDPIEFKLLYKVVNHTSHFIGNLFKRNISIQEAEKNIFQLIEPTHHKILKEFMEILDNELINPTMNEDILAHDDNTDLRMTFCKAICDIFTDQIVDVVKLGFSSTDFVNEATKLVLDSIDFIDGLKDNLKLNLGIIKRIGFIRSFFNYDFC